MSGKIDAYSNHPRFALLFSELREKFNMIKLSDVSESIFSGITPKSGGEAYCDDGIKFIRSGEILENGSVDLNIELKIKPEVHNGIMKSSKVYSQDVLIAIVGATIGKVGIYSQAGEANINQAIAGVRLKQGIIEPQFLLYYLMSKTGQTFLEYLKRPVARANINLEEIGSIEIPRLTIEEQSIFCKRFEKAIEQHNDQIAQAGKLLSGIDGYVLDVLGLAMPQFADRLSNAVTLKDIKQDGTLSADYYHPERMATIKMLLDNNQIVSEKLVTVVDFHRNTVSADGNEMRYIGLASVQSNTGELIDIEEEAGGQAFSYETGDVLYGRLRPYLNKAFAAEKDGICSTEFHVMRIKENCLLPDYLSVIMRSQIIVSQTKHMMTGNTHPRIANAEVENLLIPIPTKEVQRQIVDEAIRRRALARQLRDEAEKEWKAAKAQFEKELLGEV